MEAVRLTRQEIDTIVKAAEKVFGDRVLCIRLYGSRADLAKSGGDIDLVFELQGAPLDKFLQTQELRLELVAHLGEQKFDLLVLSRDQTVNSVRENSFFKMILPLSKIIWDKS